MSPVFARTTPDPSAARPSTAVRGGGHCRGAGRGDVLPYHPRALPFAEHREPPGGIGLEIDTGHRTDARKPDNAGRHSSFGRTTDEFQIHLRHPITSQEPVFR